VNIGIIPELASSYLLPRLLGFQRAKELIYFGDRIPAQRLFELGLINKVVPHDQLIPYAKEMALKLIPPAGAWMAMRVAKRALHGPLMQEITEALDKENEGLNGTFGTEDFREALKARAEKRAPLFRGR
jgi:2-(1,2-epoxy-1,2-dihydrophenyl)acetyl-CoA isomerase